MRSRGQPALARCADCAVHLPASIHPPRPQLARLVLPGMRARRRGAVINIGSGVSTVIPASPLLSGAPAAPAAAPPAWLTRATCSGTAVHARHPDSHPLLPPNPHPCPPSAYAGTKAYVDALSRSLAAEYARAGVAVQNQSPMFVATKMSKIRWVGCGAAPAAEHLPGFWLVAPAVPVPWPTPRPRP